MSNLPEYLKAQARDVIELTDYMIGRSQSGSASVSRQTSRVSSGQSGRGRQEDAAPSGLSGEGAEVVRPSSGGRGPIVTDGLAASSPPKLVVIEGGKR